MEEDLEAMAEALYEACPTVKPSWAQLGEVTKSVWRGEATRRRGSAQNASGCPKQDKVEGQGLAIESGGMKSDEGGASEQQSLF